MNRLINNRLLIRCMLISLTISPLLAMAQDHQDALEKISAYYSNSTSISYEVDIHYFENLNASQADYTAKMILFSIDDQLYSDITSDGKHYEQYSNKDIALEIDHQSKVVHLAKAVITKGSLNPGMANILNLAQVKGMKLEAIIDKKNKGLRLSAPESSSTVIEIFYDDQYRLLSTKMIVKVENGQYNGVLNGKKIITYYSYPKSNKTVQLSDFVHISGGKYVLAQPLNGYTLIPQN